MDNRCVCCGEIIPEGRQVCPGCENAPLRETLIEFIRQVQYLGGLEERVADHLIAKGVTVQRWIPVTERLPEQLKEYIVMIKGATHPTTLYYENFGEFWFDLSDGNEYVVTHWMPTPEPPKGE